MNWNYYKIVFASFYHDIGKALIRAGEKGSHYEAGKKYFLENFKGFEKAEEIANLIGAHHSNEKIDGLSQVKEGDHYSASFREKGEDEDKGANYDNRLIPIINYRESNMKNIPTYPLTVYSDFTEQQLLKENHEEGYKEGYKKVISPIKNEKNIKAIVNLLKKEHYNLALNYTDALFKETMFFVPSDTRGDSSHISLYSHLRTSAMVSSIIINSDKNKNKFLYVSGSIRGKQNFITSLHSNIGERKGLTKNIRGRSFLLNVLPEIICNFILTYEGINLSDIHILQSGAGKFTLILPNSDINKEKIMSARIEIDKFLYEKFGLLLEIGMVEMSQEDLYSKENEGKFIEKMNELQNNIKNDRGNPFKNILHKINKENKIEEFDYNKCKYCSEIDCEKDTNSEVEGSYICSKCDISRKLGEEISKENDYIIFIFSKFLEDYLFNIGDMKINYISANKNNIEKQLKKLQKNSTYKLFVTINSVRKIEAERKKVSESELLPFFESISNLITEGYNFSFRYNYLPMINSEKFADYINYNEDKIKFTSHILMDGNNFGRFFNEKSYIKNIEDYMILTSTLDFIFNKGIGYVYSKFLEENNIYNVFTGGDDIYIITNFMNNEKVLSEINGYINKISSKSISLSGGIVNTKPHFPIWYAKEMVNFEEKIAKEKNKEKEEDNNKWFISCYNGSVMEFENYSSNLRRITTFNKIPSSLCYNLLNIHLILTKNKNSYNRSKFNYKTSYLVERNKKGNERFCEYLNEIIGKKDEDIKIVLNQALLYSRIKGE